MSKQREAFEKWARNDGLTVERLTHGQYSAFSTQAAWEAWQASRAAALAEAIEVCEEWEYSHTVMDCLSALKEQS